MVCVHNWTNISSSPVNYCLLLLELQPLICDLPWALVKWKSFNKWNESKCQKNNLHWNLLPNLQNELHLDNISLTCMCTIPYTPGGLLRKPPLKHPGALYRRYSMRVCAHWTYGPACGDVSRAKESAPVHTYGHFGIKTHTTCVWQWAKCKCARNCHFFGKSVKKRAFFAKKAVFSVE